jgi:hypothetical protein
MTPNPLPEGVCSLHVCALTYAPLSARPFLGDASVEARAFVLRTAPPSASSALRASIAIAGELQ